MIERLKNKLAGFDRNLPSPARFFSHSMLGFCFLTAGCTTLRAPATVPSFSAAELSEVSRDGMALQVRTIDPRQMWELFDEDLQELGIVAVWVGLRNERPSPISLKAKQWRLQLGRAAHAPLSIANLFDTYYKRKRIRFYSLNTDAKARQELGRLSFKDGALGPSESQSGLIFFNIDRPPAPDWVQTSALRLRVEGVTLELPLSHATPRS